jgi:hypothetical protein
MQGLALRGSHTGGRCFGYRSVKAEDGSARLEVDEAAAEVVRSVENKQPYPESLLVRRDELERDLLRGLSESVLRSEVIDYAVAKMEEALSAQCAGIDAELERMGARKVQLQAELKRLVDLIAAGAPHQAYCAGITQREKELQEITDTLLEPRPGPLRAKLDELRTFAVSRLARIRELLAHPENVLKAREALAEQVSSITLEPVNENGKRTYLAHGRVDFFGEAGMAHSGGAGGPACAILPHAKFFVDLAA